MNNLIIGIAGGSGSGKTTLAIRLKERFGEDEVRLISHDSYYKRHDELPFAERCKLNYDHPDAFDNDLLIEHLQELKAGRAIDCPVYDYADTPPIARSYIYFKRKRMIFHLPLKTSSFIIFFISVNSPTSLS